MSGFARLNERKGKGYFISSYCQLVLTLYDHVDLYA